MRSLVVTVVPGSFILITAKAVAARPLAHSRYLTSYGYLPLVPGTLVPGNGYGYQYQVPVVVSRPKKVSPFRSKSSAVSGAQAGR